MSGAGVPVVPGYHGEEQGEAHLQVGRRGLGFPARSCMPGRRACLVTACSLFPPGSPAADCAGSAFSA